MSGWIIHEVCFRFDNPAERCSLSFEMHKVTSQQFFGDGKRILLIKCLRKNHDGPSGSASNWLAMKGGKMVDSGQEGRKHGQGAKTSLAGVNAAGRAGIAAIGKSDE